MTVHMTTEQVQALSDAYWRVMAAEAAARPEITPIVQRDTVSLSALADVTVLDCACSRCGAQPGEPCDWEGQARDDDRSHMARYGDNYGRLRKLLGMS